MFLIRWIINIVIFGAVAQWLLPKVFRWCVEHQLAFITLALMTAMALLFYFVYYAHNVTEKRKMKRWMHGKNIKVKKFGEDDPNDY